MATRKSHKIDRIDLKILSALQEQGRMSNLELAAKAGLSASPSHSRHRALERGKVIQGYRADIDLAKLIDYVEILSFVTLHKHGRTQQGAFERLIERTPQAIADSPDTSRSHVITVGPVTPSSIDRYASAAFITMFGKTSGLPAPRS